MSTGDDNEIQKVQGVETRKNSVVTVIEGKANIIGGRGSQQDFVWTGAKREGTRWGVVADGHGPDGASMAVSGGKALVNEYKRMRDQRLPFPDASRYAFNRVHSTLVAEKESRNLAGGTTAVLFDVDNRTGQPELKVANAGDSKATLINIQTGEVVLDTREHSAKDPVEAQGVRSRGGRVEAGRVSGKIAVTRGLGDTYPGMTSEPDSASVSLKPGRYLFLAYSDGFSGGMRRYLDAHPNRGLPSVEATALTHFRKYSASRSMDQIAGDLAKLAHQGYTERQAQQNKPLDEDYGDNITLVCSTIEVK